MGSLARETAERRRPAAAPESASPEPARAPDHPDGLFRAVGNDVVAAVGEAVHGGGAPLPEGLRRTMEQAFAGVADDVAAGPGEPVVSAPGDPGEREAAAVADRVTSAPGGPGPGPDFGPVRIHTGPAADEAARSLSATAYTIGDDIAFAAGRYQPGTPAGRALLAHELAHVVQQRRQGTLAVQRDSPPGAGRPGKIPGVGSKILAKGVLTWGMRIEGRGTDGMPVIQLIFTPFLQYRGKQLTFLQTVRRVKASAPDPKRRPVVDILTSGREGASQDEFEPFYGAQWDNASRTWVPEKDGESKHGNNRPSSAADPNTYLHDRPVAFRDQMKLFESVVVQPETGEVFGAIRWGIRGADDGMEIIAPDEGKDVTDAPSAEFLAAMERFYATPAKAGPYPDREERYDVIVGGFFANDGVAMPLFYGVVLGPLQKSAYLHTDQKAKLDPIAETVRDNPALTVKIGGFADATEKDPFDTSAERARAVRLYLLAQGVPPGNIVLEWFYGAAWPLFPGNPAAGRNRRVQLRLVRL
jgi:uncharacterized protein DUF4157/OmpA family protein